MRTIRSQNAFAFGSSHGRAEHSYAERRDRRVQFFRVDSIAIMDQMRVIVVPRKSFPKLLDRPFGRRMGRNVPVHDFARGDFH
ncbi:MAG: hypothetical protein JWP08_1417 [Bryobacterales bacterium]|nr:hypothetical protein [Bryobacterales bacterium]